MLPLSYQVEGILVKGLTVVLVPPKSLGADIPGLEIVFVPPQHVGGGAVTNAGCYLFLSPKTSGRRCQGGGEDFSCLSKNRVGVVVELLSLTPLGSGILVTKN